MSTPPSRAEPRFEDVVWDDVDRAGPIVDRRTVVFLACLVSLVGLYAYDFLLAGDDATLPGWKFSRLDWLFVLAMLLVAFYVVWPLARDREQTRLYWRRFRQDRVAVAALAYLGLFAFLSVLGPVVIGGPDLDLTHKFQPPVFLTVDASVPSQCLGTVSDGLCHGTWQYPLGTDAKGEGLFKLVIEGMRIGLKVGLTTAVIAIPIAVAVGTVAGFSGGRLDDVLMRYVEVQQTIPALVIYMILIFVWGRSLFALVLVFGLFNWGGVARLVRGEVVQRRDEEYVRAALATGASPWTVVRRHVLPNVSNTVVTASTRMVATLILVQAALSYLDLNRVSLRSFGETIAVGLSDYWTTPLNKWWVSTVAVVFLAITVLSFNVVGDALRDAVDPRGENA